MCVPLLCLSPAEASHVCASVVPLSCRGQSASGALEPRAHHQSQCKVGLQRVRGRSAAIKVPPQYDFLSQYPLPPLSPLVRPNSFLVLAGDPCQLPPVIATPNQVSTSAATAAPTAGKAPPPCSGLLRPMFVRLADLGHHTHLLRTQYRWAMAEYIFTCHTMCLPLNLFAIPTR